MTRRLVGPSHNVFCKVDKSGRGSCKQPSCPQCGNTKLHRDGLRSTHAGPIQRFLCRSCGYRFSESKAGLNVLSKTAKLLHSHTDLTEKVIGSKLSPSEKCRECGYRFCRTSLNHSGKTQYASRTDRQSLNLASGLLSKRQVCELLTEESKNLAIVPRQETAQREGTTSTANIKGKIVEYSFWLLKQGYSPATIKGRAKRLNRLIRLGAQLENEESVKEIIAKQVWSVSSKLNAVDAYDSFLRMLGKTWTPPIYKRVRQLPFIPTEAELDSLIAACSQRISTYLQLLKETGMRSGEACGLLKWTDIDFEERYIRITPEKNSNPRILPLSVKLIDMLNNMEKNGTNAFGTNTDLMRRNFAKQRKRIAAKVKNSRLNQITFHTFRHWKATMEYHKTRDILHVKEILGHKSLTSTMMYTQLISFRDDEYTVAVAHSEEEIVKLAEAGFEYYCDYDKNKILRKRK